MKNKDIKAMKKADLAKNLSELQASLTKARFGTVGTKSKNVKEQVNLRRDIARILTILNEKK
jgi:ribosomal protein L29